MSQTVAVTPSDPGSRGAIIDASRPAQRFGTFLGVYTLSLLASRSETEHAGRWIELTTGLRMTIFVRNAGEIAGNLI